MNIATIQTEAEALRARLAEIEAAEAEAKKKAAAEAEAKKRAEAEVAREAARKVAKAKLQGFAAAIQAAIDADKDDLVITHDDDCGFYYGQTKIADLSFYDIYSSQSWSARKTGQGVQVYMYRSSENSKKLKIKSDGTINTKSAAEAIIRGAHNVVRSNQEHAARVANTDLIADIAARQGEAAKKVLSVSKSTRYGNEYRTYSAAPGHVYFQLDCTLSAEKAEAAVAALKAAGIL